MQLVLRHGHQVKSASQVQLEKQEQPRLTLEANKLPSHIKSDAWLKDTIYECRLTPRDRLSLAQQTILHTVVKGKLAAL